MDKQKLTIDCDSVIPVAILAAWCGLIVSALAAVFVAEVRRWHRYGKLRDNQANASFMDSFTVPKRLFTVFYLVGLVWSGLLLLTNGEVIEDVLDMTICDAEQVNGMFSSFHVVPLYLMIMQCGRRLLEEAFVPTSTARMHLGGFVVGAAYYILVPVAIVRSVRQKEINMWVFGAGMIVLAYGSVHQIKCHSILRRLKRSTNTYAIPIGDWFEYSSNPHYFAEIIIYLGMYLVLLSVSQKVPLDFILALVFIVLNLGITARRTHQWYLDKFKEEYSQLNRAAMIPFVF